MNGLALSHQYYLAHGKPLLASVCPEAADRIAVGLVGEGSDCFGFDDLASRDHDWGAGFCLWLNDEDYDRIGQDLQLQYDLLPATFLGYPKKMPGKMATGRVGVIRQSEFYRCYTGYPEGPQSLADWLSVPEHFLATATNGNVFEDPAGDFSRIRERLLAFYPEDIRLKLIAKRCATMAQAGQYNVPRAIQRGEWVAAQLALGEFLQSTLSTVYLLNRRYAPFYKWMHRGLQSLPLLSPIQPMLDQLVRQSLKDQPSATEIIEAVCQLIIHELNRQQVSDSTDDFLGSHWPGILERIADPAIRSMHVFEGGL